ncbi:MAG: hypothetical protein A3K19_04735 [Lentisphaerae bacterium RIFOXYB12_FULL_65_16]|nr:MAG: hypothetical protein A3K18_11475 [Lentisphaerae bacterium RIFOXYA12_64_32]OGV84037.1 MAG: hypothetical protein A3K19_04735 [Lentisphaerae bacterium RIFOXYB12_FULL_65_16]
MTNANVNDNTRDEVRRGDEALRAARVLLEAGLFNDAVSRAYYAAFHWASAALMSRGVEAKTHRGTIQMFGLHFVKTRVLPREEAARLTELETFRELSDYAVAARFTREEAESAIDAAEAFIRACQTAIPFPSA